MKAVGVYYNRSMHDVKVHGELLFLETILYSFHFVSFIFFFHLYICNGVARCTRYFIANEHGIIRTEQIDECETETGKRGNERESVMRDKQEDNEME